MSKALQGSWLLLNCCLLLHFCLVLDFYPWLLTHVRFKAKLHSAMHKLNDVAVTSQGQPSLRRWNFNESISKWSRVTTQLRSWQWRRFLHCLGPMLNDKRETLLSKSPQRFLNARCWNKIFKSLRCWLCPTWSKSMRWVFAGSCMIQVNNMLGAMAINDAHLVSLHDAMATYCNSSFIASHNSQLWFWNQIAQVQTEPPWLKPLLGWRSPKAVVIFTTALQVSTTAIILKVNWSRGSIWNITWKYMGVRVMFLNSAPVMTKQFVPLHVNDHVPSFIAGPSLKQWYPFYFEWPRVLLSMTMHASIHCLSMTSSSLQWLFICSFSKA